VGALVVAGEKGRERYRRWALPPEMLPTCCIMTLWHGAQAKRPQRASKASPSPVLQLQPSLSFFLFVFFFLFFLYTRTYNNVSPTFLTLSF
jgi:hypothetical protein